MCMRINNLNSVYSYGMNLHFGMLSEMEGYVYIYMHRIVPPPSNSDHKSHHIHQWLYRRYIFTCNDPNKY